MLFILLFILPYFILSLPYKFWKQTTMKFLLLRGSSTVATINNLFIFSIPPQYLFFHTQCHSFQMRINIFRHWIQSLFNFAYLIVAITRCYPQRNKKCQCHIIKNPQKPKLLPSIFPIITFQRSHPSLTTPSRTIFFTKINIIKIILICHSIKSRLKL